uniref:Uncharacterized protein n=1 Tax=Globisporangium ultimum (strain ATCC 200006 / CBS 805.95 / DAOM BR144) TaxID=431595 RepID=K3WKG7_GLOUD
MDAKGSARAAPADAKKKKSTTRVKVVASRYAQALQTKNLEAQAHWRSIRASSTTPTEKTNAAARDTSKSASVAASAAATRVKMPLPAPLSSTRALTQATMATPSPAASAIETTPKPTSTHHPVVPSASSTATASEASIAASSGSDKQDLKERLLAYKASKALATQKQPAPTRVSVAAPPASSMKVTTTTIKPVKAVKASTTPRERPIFPKRIATTTIERSVKRPVKVPSEPIPSETRVLARPPTPRGRQVASVASAIAPTASRGTQNEEEELELLEAMYYQLCFTELKAEEAFRRQDQAAEKQIIAAWNLLQSKLQLLHDTSLRLDREKHILSIEENLGDQATPFVHVASKLPGFVDNLSRVCASLETSLHRLPTPGIRCSPVDVQRRLNALTVELDELLQQLQATKLDTEISNAVSFEQEMSRGVEQIGVSLLQVANLVEHLLGEVNTETSMAIQRIQEQRTETSVTRDDWW